MKDYSILLTYLEAKSFSEILHNLKVGYEASGCGNKIYFSIRTTPEKARLIAENFVRGI